MATAATSLLGLALPVTGELSGTWGDTVNVSITALLDTAVAGTTTLSSDADVTLTTTTLAANQARQAIILWTAGGTVTRTITVPAQSKSYIVINKTSSSQSIKIVGVGPTTGVTIVAGTAAFVVWNGVDFVTASVTSTTGILPVANGGTGLSSGTSGGVLAYTATGTLASSTALAASALVIGGGAGAAPSTTTTGTGVVTALGVNTGSAGAFVVNGGALGTPSSGTVTNLTGTASININGTVGATTPGTGAFTSLTASTTLGVTGVSTLTAGAVVQGLTVGLGAGAVAGNTAVGVSALAGNSTGARLTAVGASAGVLNTASDNSFVGYNAGTTNTSGINNTALGSQALYTNSVGGNNTAIGYTALLLNTGSNNTAVGGGPYPYATLGNNSSGAANTAVGTSALAQNTTASNNTAVGYQAGYSNTTGELTAIGTIALYENTTGEQNTAVGYVALTKNTTGSSNTGIGRNSIRLNETGSYNTGLGHSSLYNNLSASYNTAVGYQAGYTNQIGAFNVFVGGLAGQGSTGSGNTFIGGGNNSAGYPAGFFMTGNNSVVIGGYGGNQDSLDIRTSNDYVVLATGNGNRQITMAEGQTLALDSAVPNSGTGITFPATQSASSNANTLDDYEEGTWTPSVGGDATYTTQAGRYTKIGNIVYIQGQININLLGTGSASTLSGLPFTSASSTSEGGFNATFFGGLAVNVIQPVLGVDASSTNCTVYSRTTAGTGASAVSVFGNSARLFFYGHYQVA